MTTRTSPSIDRFLSVARVVRETAERSGDLAGEVSAYSVLWFLGTGRSFIGLDRACAHMPRGTARAFLRRVSVAMCAVAAGRGATVPVTADLTNGLLAGCLGFSSVEAAVDATCGHQFGSAYLMGKAA